MGIRRSSIAPLSAVLCAGGLVAIVPSVSASGTSVPATSAPVTSEVTATTASADVVTTLPATEPDAPAVTAVGADGVWTQVSPGGDCQCSDGSQFSFWTRQADPTKVVFMLEGGGACFSPETCATDGTGAYSMTTGLGDDPSDRENFAGVFDLENPDNPFADYSFVFVPYCTGDVHLGDNTHEYAPGLVVQHKGMVNGTAAAEYLAENFPDAAEVVVVGESAGAVASPLYGGILSDLVPDAAITVFADGSGGYPDVEGINVLIGDLWGSFAAAPDWEVNAAIAPEDWSLPGLWVQAGTHDPEITMARFDYAYDEVQVMFAGLAGTPADELLAFMDANEAWIESAGVEQDSFTAPGDDHTLVRKDEFYAMEVGGVALSDWVADLVSGEPVDDVHCEVCEAAADPA